MRRYCIFSTDFPATPHTNTPNWQRLLYNRIQNIVEADDYFFRDESSIDLSRSRAAWWLLATLKTIRLRKYNHINRGNKVATLEFMPTTVACISNELMNGLWDRSILSLLALKGPLSAFKTPASWYAREQLLPQVYHIMRSSDMDTIYIDWNSMEAMLNWFVLHS